MAAPAKLISTSVGFQDGQGTLAVLGFLSLQLEFSSEVIATGGQVTTQAILLPLDANAKITTKAIWFSDELSGSPRYKAVLYASNGSTIINDFGFWSITGASADLSLMTPSATSGSFIDPVIKHPLVTQTVVQPTGTSLNVNRFENVRFADQFSSIDAAVADIGSNPGIVIIPSNYSGSESSNLKTSNLGYTYYSGAQNVSVWDFRNIATAGGKNYSLTFGGSSLGQLSSFSVVKNSASATDSSAAATFTNFITGTQPTNGGSQQGCVSIAATDGTGWSDTHGSAIIAHEAYVSLGATGGASLVPSAYGFHGSVNIDRSNTTQQATTAAAFHAGANTNTSGSGGVITNSYGLMAIEQTAGASRNYALFGVGKSLIGYGASSAQASIWFEDSANTPHLALYVDSTNNLQIGGTSSAGVQLQDGGYNSQLQVSSSGTKIFNKVFSYNGVNTEGNGLSAIYKITSQKSESAADTNVLTFTPPASTGTYRIHFVLSLSAASAAVLGWTATWKDANGNAKSPTNLSLFQIGTAAPALTFTTSTATDEFYGDVIIDVDNSATAIVVKMTLGSGTFTGKASATVERLQ